MMKYYHEQDNGNPTNILTKKEALSYFLKGFRDGYSKIVPLTFIFAGFMIPGVFSFPLWFNLLLKFLAVVSFLILIDLTIGLKNFLKKSIKWFRTIQ